MTPERDLAGTLQRLGVRVTARTETAVSVDAGLGRLSRAQVRVLVADDHRLLREGVRRSLEMAGIVVVGEAGDGMEALRLAGELRPDVVLMDVTMPVLDGIDATLALVRRHPAIRVIVLTMHDDDDVWDRARDAGAAGYLVKDCTGDEIVETIASVLGDRTRTRVGLHGSEPGKLPAAAPAPSPASTAGWAEHALTPRELEVLCLLAQGASTAQLAGRLFISPKTVKNHLASIYSKLDAANRTQAVVQAARLGLIHVG